MTFLLQQFRPAVLALLLLSGAAGAWAQSPPAAEPRAGQRGKDVMWIATVDALAERMLGLAGVTDKDYVIDLGSGDGVLVIAAAKRGARAHGIEYDQKLYELSLRLAAEAGVAGRATFARADIFQSDLSAASVITLYLNESLNARLRPQLLALKPGTRIVSNKFKFGEWREDDSTTAFSWKSLIAPFVDNPTDHCFFLCTAYLWIIPAKVEGRWRTSGGELDLRQSFQMVSGTLAAGGKSAPVQEGRLRGDAISFTAGDTTYAGKVAAGRIDGTARRNGVASPWNATLSASGTKTP